jgi:hypothetical protein
MIISDQGVDKSRRVVFVSTELFKVQTGQNKTQLQLRGAIMRLTNKRQSLFIRKRVMLL